MEHAGGGARGGLAQEFLDFYKYQNQVRKIYSETCNVFTEVQHAGLYSQSRCSTSSSDSCFSCSTAVACGPHCCDCETKNELLSGFAELSRYAPRELELLNNAKICIFIAGDSSLEKLMLVNQLLGLSIMPVDAVRDLMLADEGKGQTEHESRGASSNHDLMSVHMTYSRNFSVNMRPLGQPVDVFEATEDTDAFDDEIAYDTNQSEADNPSSAGSISLSQLVTQALNDGSNNTQSRSCEDTAGSTRTVLEVGVDSPLLRNGTRIVLSSSNLGHLHPNERETSDELCALLDYVLTLPSDTLLLFLYVTRGAARACHDLLLVRARHSNILPILVMHPALISTQKRDSQSNAYNAFTLPHSPPGCNEYFTDGVEPTIFDVAFASALTEAGFSVFDPQINVFFDLSRLSDTAFDWWSISPFEGFEDAGSPVQSFSSSATGSIKHPSLDASSSVQSRTPSRCDLVLVDRLCVENVARADQSRSSVTSMASFSTSSLYPLQMPIDAEHWLAHDVIARAASFGLRRLIVHGTVQLYEAQHRALQHFVLAAFDVARDMQVTPKRLAFVREKEQFLFGALMELASRKRDEIHHLVADSIAAMQRSLPTLIEGAFLHAAEIAVAATADNASVEGWPTAETVRKETMRIRELVYTHLTSEISEQLTQSVEVLRDSYTGTLARCVKSLEVDVLDSNSSTDEIQESTGTGSQPLVEPAASAVESLKRLVSSTYSFELSLQSSAKLVRVVFSRANELLRTAPWNVPVRVDNVWRVAVAREMLSALSATRLARSVTAQMRERLRNAHNAFASALRSLEHKHLGRLERAGTTRDALRTKYTPRVARLLLETASIRDVTLYGIPRLGKELGRGQYGVVFACESWAQHNVCAVKSVVPPDENHWNDLALEFFYTRRIGEHERLVKLHGCVVDSSYTESGPAVLLVMERMFRDLHIALQRGLVWHDRLQIAVDVIEGLRYIHAQGLVHRDIKLSNVLLNNSNRAKISDMGFCKPEAMMCGSVVGTPIHMAPELLSGKYDASVDIYAFGILFWYLCAGRVCLPTNYEECYNTEMLWDAVSRGMRPERLQLFADWCWNLMCACWEPEPWRRALLGDIESLLREKLDVERRVRTSSRSQRSNSASPPPVHSPARPINVVNRSASRHASSSHGFSWNVSVSL